MSKSDLKSTANSERVILAFNGAIETRILTNLTNPPRAFAFEVTFHPHLWPAMLQEKKPPLHFHPFQEEYIQVQAGRLCVEQSGRKQILSAADGEICIKPWVHHCLYPLAEDVSGPVSAAIDTQAREEEKTIKFLISGEETDRIFRLDTIFFENWYAYQDEVILQNKSIDLIQVLTMFDAGGSYLSLPWWIPFNRTVSMSIGVAVGRWLAPLLGYQPYYAKWTSDWQLACEKMEKSLFQRRFAMKKKD